MDKEIWRAIPGYNGIYEVSNHGRVRSWHNNRHGKGDDCRILNEQKSNSGYLVVGLCLGGDRKIRYIHQLVAEGFVDNPDSKELALHKDGVKTNNYYENIYWGSWSDNMKDRVRHGTSNRGERQGLSKLTKEDVIYIKSNKDKYPQGHFAEKFDVSISCISAIYTGKNWGHVKV